MKKMITGFTLIELAVVIAMIGVLTAIAVPTYNRYIQKSRRLEGQNNLLNIQANYEEYFAQNNAYPASNTLPPSGSIPATTYYTYTSSVSGTTYTMTATAIVTKSQNTDKEGATSCSQMQIDNTSLQTPAACWPQ